MADGSLASAGSGYADATATNAPVIALSRGLSILSAFGASPRPLSLAELARATGLHKTTALRLLLTLTEAGFVQRRGCNYELGPAAFQLGLNYQRSHLLHLVRPALDDLLAHDCESPSFHVQACHRTRLCLLRVDGRDGRADGLSAGDVLPLGLGAPGHVLRTFQEGTPPLGETVDVTVSWGERVPGCASVAAPVFGRGERLCGAISISGPQARFGKPALQRMSRQVLRTASRLTAKLGGDATVFQTC